MLQKFSVRGNLVDILNRKVQAAEVAVAKERIQSIEITSANIDASLPYILPGL